MNCPWIECFISTGFIRSFGEGDGGFWGRVLNVVHINQRWFLVEWNFLWLKRWTCIVATDEYKICFKFQHHLSKFKVHSNIKYNRLESCSLLCHQQVLLAIKKYRSWDSKPLIQQLGRLVGYRTEKYPITEKSVKKKTKTFNSINKKIIGFFNIDRVLGFVLNTRHQTSCACIYNSRNGFNFIKRCFYGTHGSRLIPD
jgi:hypothetical protein